jgi:Protein of unknown function (DUF1569)
MKSIFEQQVFEETVNRIEGLSPSATRQWGKMSAAQMCEHCARAAEMALGRGRQKQILLGKLIGWTVRKRFVGEEPFQKNGPTGPDFIIHDEPDFAATKLRLVGIVRELHVMGEAGTDGHVHGFFGPMSGEEWGITQYKHLDHHLRQFGA